MKPEAIIALGADGDDALVVEKAMDFSMKVIVIEPNDSAPGVKKAHKHINLNPSESMLLVSALDKYFLEYKFRGVICFTADQRDITRARIAQRYNLSGPDPNAVETVLSRRSTLRTLESAGVPVPSHGIAETSAQAVRVAERLNYPIQVHTLDHDSGSPAKLCENDNDLHVVFHAYPGNPFSGELLLQHAFEGQHLIVTGLVARGMFMPFPIIEKHYRPTSDALLPEMLLIPADLSDSQIREVNNAARQAVAALELDNTAVTVELTSAWDGAHVTCVLPNISMDIADGLLPHATGIEVVHETIRLALGQMPDLEPTKNELALAIYFYPQKPGELMDVGGAEALDVQGIHKVSFLPPGTDVWEPVSFYDHIGKVVISAPTKLVLETLKKQVRDTITISIK